MNRNMAIVAALFICLAFAALLGEHANAVPPAQASAVMARPVHWEVSFSLPGLTGNPFDYKENDVRAVLRLPNGQTATTLAFFDGGDAWRVRYNLRTPGTYKLESVTRNGAIVKPQNIVNAKQTLPPWTKPAPAFVRVDPKSKTRFVFDGGLPYYPVGNNVAWQSGGRPDVPELLNRMGAAGENWSRIWMNHWDGKNLDWPRPKNTPLGTLNLQSARRWDTIVSAAEKNGIYFQMTLQHHGQYSTRVNSNWGENPWNKANAALGGFLQTPDEFFKSETARELTRAKYRYIVARYGYSPNVLAWELFNEVQFTDAIYDKQAGNVAAWHKEMAQFLRSVDANHHLITTSSDTSIPHLYDAVDYVQPHSYPVDGIATVLSARPGEWSKPLFYGEIGPTGVNDTKDGTFLHGILWASLVSDQSGAAQYWAWDDLEKNDLWHQYKSVTEFLAQPWALYAVRNLTARRAVSVKTSALSAVSFGPGGDWGKGEQTDFTVDASGDVPGVGKMPSFLQGAAHRDLFTRANFAVNFPKAGTFTVAVRQSSKAGAHLVITVDGAKVGERDFPAASADQNLSGPGLAVPIPAGKHTIRLENTGADWLVLQKLTLSSYGPGLRVLAKGSATHAVLWAYRPAPSGEKIAGTITLPAFTPGKYHVQWWDTRGGKPMEPARTAAVGANKTLVLQTPAIAQDAAALITPVR